MFHGVCIATVKLPVVIMRINFLFAYSDSALDVDGFSPRQWSIIGAVIGGTSDTPPGGLLAVGSHSGLVSCNTDLFSHGMEDISLSVVSPG